MPRARRRSCAPWRGDRRKRGSSFAPTRRRTCLSEFQQSQFNQRPTRSIRAPSRKPTHWASMCRRRCDRSRGTSATVTRRSPVKPPWSAPRRRRWWSRTFPRWPATWQKRPVCRAWPSAISPGIGFTNRSSSMIRGNTCWLGSATVTRNWGLACASLSVPAKVSTCFAGSYRYRSSRGVRPATPDV